jgi:hypothetical protein
MVPRLPSILPRCTGAWAARLSPDATRSSRTPAGRLAHSAPPPGPQGCHTLPCLGRPAASRAAVREAP